MEAIVSAGLALLSSTAPLLSTTSQIGSAIKFVSSVLPPAIQLAQDEIPIIKGIIADLRGNKSITAAQLAELDTLDAQCDARLDAAIKKAEAEDAAAGQT